jgi:hypothetical protein
MCFQKLLVNSGNVRMEGTLELRLQLMLNDNG